MKEPIGCEAKKREKHIEIHDAIQSIDIISRQLDELIYRMEGPVPRTEECDNGKESPPNFMEVLNGGAEAIRDKIESTQKRITRLHELLF